jgi:hypothetical protein
MPWSNSAPSPYVLLLRNGIQTSVPGVQSETQENLQLFDGETYRDELDATFLGTGRTLQINKTGGGGIVVTNGEQTVFNGSAGTDTYTFATPSDPHLEQSDSFTHTAPRPVESTRTRLLWWSGAAGGGNVVGWAWADQVVDFSPSAHVRI